MKEYEAHIFLDACDRFADLERQLDEFNDLPDRGSFTFRLSEEGEHLLSKKFTHLGLAADVVCDRLREHGRSPLPILEAVEFASAGLGGFAEFKRRVPLAKALVRDVYKISLLTLSAGLDVSDLIDASDLIDVSDLADTGDPESAYGLDTEAARTAPAVSTRELAVICNVRTKTVNSWVQKGVINAIDSGGRGKTAAFDLRATLFQLIDAVHERRVRLEQRVPREMRELTSLNERDLRGWIENDLPSC